MSVLVVDASVAVKWVFNEPGHEAARQILASDTLLIAPDHVVAELAQTAWKRFTRGEIGGDNLPALVGAARLAFSELVPSAVLVERAMALSVELRHAAYDCLYLALAENRRCPIVMADERFARSIQSTRYAALVRQL